MYDVFESRNLDYKLRLQIGFLRTRVSTSSFGLKYLTYLAIKISDIVPNDNKSVGHLSSFKEKIRNREPK